METVKAHLLPLVIGVIGLALLLLGLFQILSHKSQNNLTYQPAVSAPSTSGGAEITVDVEGAVMNPGVYKLKADTRVVDVLASAGGMSEDADRDYVQKSINLAQKITDGIKVYIPRVGEQVKGASVSTLGIGSTISDSSSVININSASLNDLDKLPGVGAVTAQKIIDGRPYASTNELLSKKVVGQSEFNKIKDQISAN